jgi:hypothetical protein
VCITTLLGKRACFVVQEPGKPQVNSDLLREGEKDSSITNLEVLQIDPRAGSVKVNYGNKQLTLDFKSNGIAPPVGPAIAAPGPMLAGRPGGPGGPLGGPPAPGLPPPGLGQASQPVAADSGRGLRPIPTRPTRLPLGEGTGYGFGATGGSGRYGYNTSAQAQNQPNLSAEQQVVIMKAQEQQAVRTGIPFPPTPGLDFQPGTQGAAQGQQAGPELPPVPGAPIPLPPTPGN